MKPCAFSFFSVFLFLFLLPGCGRIIDWGVENVDQGTNLCPNLCEARNQIRSSRIYDQFTLVGMFDSLWLNDLVREVYADLYALKHGRTEEEKKIFLRRQLEENNHFISFYVLSASEFVLGEVDSEWTLLLNIKDYYFVPTELKVVELVPEYEAIFGKKFNKFKTVYILRFNAKDIEDAPLIQPDTDSVNLVFRSVKKETVHAWCSYPERVVECPGEVVA